MVGVLPDPTRSRRRRAVAAALALAATAAGAEPMGPPAPQEPARRVYAVRGFEGVDDRELRRALERSRELYVAAAAADFGATQYALNLGGVEANPLIPDRGLVVPVKVVAVWATLEIEEHLRRGGHPVWAELVRWAFVALNVGAAAWNVQAAPP